MNFKFKGKSYKLPTSWGEVSLGKYMDILNLDDELTDIEKRCEIISILTGIEYNDVKEIKIRDLKFIENNLSFINNDENFKLMEEIKIKDKIYYLQTNLDDMNMGQFTDLETFSKPEKYKNTLHYLMAILYREKKETGGLLKNLKSYIYNRKDIVNHDVNFEERSEIFKQYMTVDVLKSALVFFSILKIGLINHSLGYSEKEIQETIENILQQMKKSLLKNGDGMAQFMKSLHLYKK